MKINSINGEPGASRTSNKFSKLLPSTMGLWDVGSSLWSLVAGG